MNLLSLANSPAGRQLLGIKDNYPIVKITPNSFHQVIGFRKNRQIIQASFFATPRILEIFNPIITKMQIANEYREIVNRYEAFLHFSGIERRVNKYPQVLLTVTDFTPNSGGSGIISTGVQATWAAARGASTGTVDTGSARIQSWNFGSGFVNDRYFLTFDTSSLGASAIISALTIKLYRNDADTYADADSTSIEIVPTTPTNPVSLASGDYDNLSYTSKGSATLASTTVNTYKTITISDFTVVNLTSYTTLGAISGRDLSNSSPSGRNEIVWEHVGGSNPPTLTVTYTIPSVKAKVNQVNQAVNRASTY